MDRRRFIALSAMSSLAAAFTSDAVAQQASSPSIARGWGAPDMPSQAGRTVVITGGNGAPRTIPAGTFPPAGVYSGLGYQQARALAGKGANVIIASRNSEKGREAVESIKAEHPAASIRFESLDLSELTSVQAFSDRLRSQVDRVDLLINNAATGGTPDRQVNSAGQELCWATNVAGHFALTTQMFPLLRKGATPRVVFLSSGAAQYATNFDDLQTEREYDSFKAYVLSKAAVLILARDLDRRSTEAGLGVNLMASHPGIAKTFLIPSGPGPDSFMGRNLLANTGNFRPAETAVIATLYAATHPDAQGGMYYGPVNDRYKVGISQDHAPGGTPDVAARLYAELLRTTGRGIG